MNNPDDHFCQMPEESMTTNWGPAISVCKSGTHGVLYAGNGEYGSQVNFCPICGYEAMKKIDD